MGSDQKKKVASGHSFYLQEVQIVDICFCWSYTIHAAYGVEIEASEINFGCSHFGRELFIQWHGRPSWSSGFFRAVEKAVREELKSRGTCQNSGITI